MRAEDVKQEWVEAAVDAIPVDPDSSIPLHILNILRARTVRHALAAVIPKVRAEEREVCARIAMEYPILETEGTATAHARVMQGLAIAVAIRSRGGAP